MTPSRSGQVLLWVMLCLAVPAAVTYLVVSVVHFVGSATEYHDRVTAPQAGAARPTTAVAAQLDAAQMGWGVHAMFAVAATAGAAVLTLIVWLLDLQRAAARRAAPPAPSPGTPGEGWGEGPSTVESRSPRDEDPHPNPLPAYRERGPDERTR